MRTLRDEAGMAMGIALIMIVLIGLMGAGLLTFVSRDLNAVVAVNEGQRALEAADAGVQAARKQLVGDTVAACLGGETPCLGAADHYDGAPTNDLPWSYCYNVPLCTGVAPTATGSSGARVNLPSGDYAQVTIRTLDRSVETYKVISEGRAGDARRKVEAIVKQNAKVNMAPVYFSRSDITVTGSAAPTGISFFAVGNVDIPSPVNFGTSTDTYFGSWAETTGAGPYPNALGSYPNTSNKTARPSNQIGVAAQGQITGANSFTAMIGTRSFDSDTLPYRVVPNYDASPLLATQKIAFPFDVPTPADDAKQIEALRQRALALEQANPGQEYYIDSNPGNGRDDAGMPDDPTFRNPLLITTWPASSTYETVMFYEFQSYHPNNRVSYQTGASSCGTTTNRGVITIVNGDAVFEGNRRFDGGIVVRAYDPSGNLLPDSGGLFSGAGNPCLYGYVNTGGDQMVAGNLAAGTTPGLSSLPAFRGSMDVESWRELYE